MITTEIKYNSNFKNNIKLKKSFNIIFFSFSFILITFAAVFMALAMKEKGVLNFFNLFFSVISIILQVFFMIIIGYDYYYLNKIENRINKNGSYNIKLSKPKNIVNKKYSLSTIILFIMSIFVFLVIIAQLTVMLVKKDFYNSFATLLLNLNNLTYILFCFISCAYSDQLHFFNIHEFGSNNEIQTGISTHKIIKTSQQNEINVHTANLLPKTAVASKTKTRQLKNSRTNISKSEPVQQNKTKTNKTTRGKK